MTNSLKLSDLWRPPEAAGPAEIPISPCLSLSSPFSMSLLRFLAKTLRPPPPTPPACAPAKSPPNRLLSGPPSPPPHGNIPPLPMALFAHPPLLVKPGWSLLLATLDTYTPPSLTPRPNPAITPHVLRPTRLPSTSPSKSPTQLPTHARRLASLEDTADPQRGSHRTSRVRHCFQGAKSGVAHRTRFLFGATPRGHFHGWRPPPCPPPHHLLRPSTKKKKQRSRSLG